MGLDVYVGSLTRYYTEGPADVVERIARHQGMAVADGQDAEEVIRAAVLRWRENLSRWLGAGWPARWTGTSPPPPPASPTSRAGTATAGPCCWPPTTSIPSCRPRPSSPPTGPTTSPTRPPRPGGPAPATLSCSPRSCGCPAGSSSPCAPRTSPARRSSSAPAWALLEQLELLAARFRLEADPPDPSADGHSLSAAAGNGLAVLRRLAARSVRSRVPMKLDF